MKIRINIDKAEAVKRGGKIFGPQVTNLPIDLLSQEDRDILATADDQQEGCDEVLQCGGWGYAPTPDLDGLRAVIAARREKLAAEENERREREDAAARLRAEVLASAPDRYVRENRIGHHGGGVVVERKEYSVYIPGVSYPGSTDPDLSAYIDLANGIAAERSAKARVDFDQRYAAAVKTVADAVEAKRAPLRAWAMEHGTTILRARIEGAEAEGWEWEGLARQEFADALEAGLGLERDDEKGTTADRPTPTLAEIDALKRVRTVLGEGHTAELVWFKPTEDPGTPERDYPLIEVSYATPDGREVQRYYRVPAPNANPQQSCPKCGGSGRIDAYEQVTGNDPRD